MRGGSGRGHRDGGRVRGVCDGGVSGGGVSGGGGRSCGVRGGGSGRLGREGRSSCCRADRRGSGGSRQGHLALPLAQPGGVGGVAWHKDDISIPVWCAESLHDQLLSPRHRVLRALWRHRERQRDPTHSQY